MTKLVKVALVLALSVTGISAAHSDDELATRRFRFLARTLSKGGNRGGEGGKPTTTSGSTCAAVGSACCETKYKGKPVYSCDSSYVSTLSCMFGVCVPDLTRKEQEGGAEAPKCVFTACGQAATLNEEVVYCPADEGQRCADLVSGSFCDTCSSLKCSEVGDAIPSDFDKSSFWPCFGTCLPDGVSCKTADGQDYIY